MTKNTQSGVSPVEVKSEQASPNSRYNQYLPNQKQYIEQIQRDEPRHHDIPQHKQDEQFNSSFSLPFVPRIPSSTSPSGSTGLGSIGPQFNNGKSTLGGTNVGLEKAELHSQEPVLSSQGFTLSSLNKQQAYVTAGPVPAPPPQLKTVLSQASSLKEVSQLKTTLSQQLAHPDHQLPLQPLMNQPAPLQGFQSPMLVGPPFVQHPHHIPPPPHPHGPIGQPGYILYHSTNFKVPLNYPPGQFDRPFIMNGSPEGMDPSYNSSSLSLMRNNIDELDPNSDQKFNTEYYNQAFGLHPDSTPSNFESQLHLQHQHQLQQQQFQLQQQQPQQPLQQQQGIPFDGSNGSSHHNSLSSEVSSQNYENANSYHLDLGESDEQFNNNDIHGGDFHLLPTSNSSFPNSNYQFGNDDANTLLGSSSGGDLYLNDQNALLLHGDGNDSESLHLENLNASGNTILDGGLNNNNGSIGGMNYSPVSLDSQSNSQQPKRSRASGENLNFLIDEFNKNSNPSSSIRKMISIKTGMSERSVRIWFQNRRAKARKLEKLTQNDPNYSQSSSYEVMSSNGTNMYNNGNFNNTASDMATVSPNQNSSNSLNANQGENEGEYSGKSSLSSFHNHSKLPILINEKYSLVDSLSISVGTWQRIKSGYLNSSILKNLHNLSPRLLNNLMLTTDLLIILSKRDNELNYFFSGVFQNEKVLFRIFFPLINIVSCSLINNHTQKSKVETNQNYSPPPQVKLEMNDDSSSTSNMMSPNSGPNSITTSPHERSSDSSFHRNSSTSSYFDHSQLRMQLAAPPKFAVHFLRDPSTGKENPNQWSICEDFSEGQQVMNAFIGEGGSEAHHILTGDIEYLQYLNSAIVSFNQSLSNMPLRNQSQNQVQTSSSSPSTSNNNNIKNNAIPSSTSSFSTPATTASSSGNLNANTVFSTTSYSTASTTSPMANTGIKTSDNFPMS